MVGAMLGATVVGGMVGRRVSRIVALNEAEGAPVGF